MGAYNLKNMSPNIFDFRKIFKIHEKNGKPQKNVNVLSFNRNLTRKYFILGFQDTLHPFL